MTVNIGTSTKVKSSYAELEAVLAEASRPSSPSIRITEHQLLGLQYRWINRLSARLDQAIESGAATSLIDAVAAAWRELAAEQPTLRELLDVGEQGCPALDEAMRREFAILALAAGIAGLDDPTEEAIQLGRAYRDLIRSGLPSLVRSCPGRSSRPAARTR